MDEIGNLNEEVASLNSQLQLARHDATRSGNQIIELKKLLDYTKRTLCNETEKLESLEHGLRSEIATGQTALARANVRIQNQSKEISSLHSLQQKYHELAENQQTTSKQILNENKKVKQRIGHLEDTTTRSQKHTNSQEKHIMELTRSLDCTKRTLCNETEKLRPLEQQISSLKRHLSSEQNKLLVAHQELTDWKKAISRVSSQNKS